MPVLANDWLATAPGAQDFADVYRSVRDVVRAATIDTMRTTPGFARYATLVASTEDPQVAYARHWAGIEAALGGDWAAHAAAVRVMGPLCARLGVSLDDWRHLMEQTGTVLRDALFARFGAEPARLKNAVALMHRFYDHALAVFTESYIEATHVQLEQSETLLQLTSIGHVLVDERGYFVRANRAFLEMYGLDDATVRTRRLKSLFEPTALDHVARDVYPAVLKVGHASYDSVHVRADGTTFPVHIEAVRVAGTELWGHSLYDLTERTQVEALRAHALALEAENETVREANRLKSEFLANMSHELRTPLNAILGFSDLLERGEVGPLSEQQLDFIHDVHVSGKHLLRLINDLLDLSKVEAGKIELEPEDVDLHVLTTDSLQLFRVAAAARSLSLDVDLDPAVRTVRLDPGRYRQVLANYVSNALKFSPAGGRVRIELRAVGDDRFRLAVSDQGVGIAPSDLGRLFLSFEQLDAGRAKKHAGTGLGLALTKRLVEAQGGTVGIASELGHGSTFFAILPRQP